MFDVLMGNMLVNSSERPIQNEFHSYFDCLKRGKEVSDALRCQKLSKAIECFAQSLIGKGQSLSLSPKKDFTRITWTREVVLLVRSLLRGVPLSNVRNRRELEMTEFLHGYWLVATAGGV